MVDGNDNPDGLWDAAWRQLQDGIADHGPTLVGVLTSIGTEGGPAARVMALRGADRESGTVTAYADSQSDKIAEFRADPRAGLLLWLEKAGMQIRLSGRAEITTGPQIQAVWDTMPAADRRNYGVTPPPGTPIDSSGAFERRPGPKRLAVLTLHIERADIVVFGADHDRRALFTSAGNWRGTWLAP